MTTLCQLLTLFMLPCPAADGSMTLSTARAALVVAGYDGDMLNEAVAIVACEQGRWYEYRSGVGESAIIFPVVAVGDGGLAVGLFQIHPLWVDYHYQLTGETLDRADPVDNATLARTINDYDMTRYSTPWNQWSCKWAADNVRRQSIRH